MITLDPPLLTVKQLASALQRSRKYVYRMKSLGFRMPGGTATLDEARKWLEKNPNPCKETKG